MLGKRLKMLWLCTDSEAGNKIIIFSQLQAFYDPQQVN